MQGPGGRSSSPTQPDLPNIENDLANAPYEKQHSVLLRKGSSIKKVYTRWESRGKWWAERDEAGAFDDGAQEKSQSSLGQRLQLARDRLVHWFRTLGTVSRKHPSTLLLPLLLLAACLAGGIAGVELAANKAAQQAQDVARAAAEQTAVSLEMLLGGQVLQPAAALAALVEERPRTADLAALLPPGFAVATGGGGGVTGLLLAPFGVAMASGNAMNGSSSSTSSGGSSTTAVDLSQTPLRGGVLAAVREQAPALAVVRSGNSGARQQQQQQPPADAELLRLLALQPVFVSGVDRSEDWGQLRGVLAGAPATATAGGAASPASSDATAAPPLADLNSAECGGACYVDSTRSKLWGFTGAAVPLAAALAAPDSGLTALASLGYRYRLSMRVSPAVLLEDTSAITSGTGSTGRGSGTGVMLFRIATGGADTGASSEQADLVTAAQSAAAPSGQRLVSVPVRLSPSAAAGNAPALTQTAAQQQAQAAQAATTYGELQVTSDTGSWRPAWEGPLIAVVVCVSAAVAWLLLVALLAYRRHTALLQAMLPEDVLALLASGQRYYQHLDNVTVLYADVVRYMAVGSDNHQHKSADLKSAQNGGGIEDGGEGGGGGGGGGGPGAGGADQTSGGTGLPTRDVVKLLNAVHSMYDGIMAKYGLVKIQRSGESFLAVGGCTPAPGATRSRALPGAPPPAATSKGAASTATPMAAGSPATAGAAPPAAAPAEAGAPGAAASIRGSGGEEDPVAVAVRVASAARDMVLATARFRGSGGFRVQLRVGLHSGPAVAAVVGTRLPRFSLFGDVVDVAYYMEATGSAMAVHVSQTTMQLLTLAGNPLLQLQPRGPLDMGAAPGEMGAMSTAWLRLEALPDPTIEAEAEARARAAAGLPYTPYSAAAAAGRRGGAASGSARVSTAGSERSGGGGVRS